MKRSCLALIVLSGTVFAVSAARAEDWWGRKLSDTPTDFTFGYGSLINTASRNATAGGAVAAIPVRISAAFGYLRAWNDRSPSGFTALGLRKANPGEQASTINGVLYPESKANGSRFDEREQGYVRVEIPRMDVAAVSWQQLPPGGHVWVYVPARQGGNPGTDLPEADADFPILQSYIDVVLEGALEYGTDYAKELIETTTGWSRYWLNDREMARRPWVHDNRYQPVDHLLQNTAPAASVFADRLFAEAYAAHWLTPKRE